MPLHAARCVERWISREFHDARARNAPGAHYKKVMTTRPPPPRGERTPALQRRRSLAMNVALEVVAELRERDRLTAQRIVDDLMRR